MPRKRHASSPSLSAISGALQAARKQKGMTQAGLAERTGRTQGHISAIEKGTHDPRASTLIDLASALGCEWVLVSKERAGEVQRAYGVTSPPTSPPTLLEEVYVPEPEREDDDGD